MWPTERTEGYQEGTHMHTCTLQHKDTIIHYQLVSYVDVRAFILRPYALMETFGHPAGLHPGFPEGGVHPPTPPHAPPLGGERGPKTPKGGGVGGGGGSRFGDPIAPLSS